MRRNQIPPETIPVRHRPGIPRQLGRMVRERKEKRRKADLISDDETILETADKFVPTTASFQFKQGLDIPGRANELILSRNMKVMEGQTTKIRQ